MPSQNHTTHYGLTQYSDNGSDRVSFLGDYTGDMAKIDETLFGATDSASNAITEAKSAQTKADTATTTANKALSNSSQASTDASNALNTATEAAMTATNAKASADTATNVSNEASTIAKQAKAEADENKAKKEDKGVAYPKDISDKRFAIWPKGLIQENMIIIGDSISYGTGASALTQSWANMIGAERESTVTNISANNAGYVNGPTFMSELQSFSGDKNAVTHIVIVGGANDKLQKLDDVTSAAQALYRYAITNFPNARVFAIPCLLGFYGGDRYHGNIMNTVHAIELALSRVRGVVEIPYGWEWLAGNERWSSDYSIHPNDNGNRELMRIISNCIDSSHSYRNSWKGEVYGANGHGNVIHGEAWATAGIYSVNIQMKITGTANSYSPFVSVSNAGSWANNTYVPNSINKLLYTNDNDSAQAHRCSIACTDNLADGTEIYLSYSKGVAA